MKKCISIVALLALIATGAFAQSSMFSVGGGAYFDLGILTPDGADDNQMGVGGYGFFDLTYAEIDVGFGYYRLLDAEVYGADLNFAVLGKYPINMGSFTLFPLLGVKLDIPLTQSYDGEKNDDYEVADNMRLGFQVGIGFDFPLSESLFIRPSVLFNLNLFAPGEDPFDDTLYSVGPMVKVGVGYKF